MPGSRDDDINYSGKPEDYTPPTGAQPSSQNIAGSINLAQGYHNISQLKDDLNTVVRRSGALIDAAESKLDSYALKVESGSKLAKAQEADWPEDLGEAKDYVSYKQYRSSREVPTRASDYIVKTYEDKIRGPAGTNAVDIIYAAETMKNEAENIESFLDKYMGDVNDTAEYRTLELLQDWAFYALKHTGRIRSLHNKETEEPPEIPVTEVAKLQPEDAEKYQALFQVKINATNNEIRQITGDLDKDYKRMSNIYYDRFLGPALDFRLNVGRDMEGKGGPDSFLAKQAEGANRSLKVSFDGTLSDQIRRNTIFDKKMEQLEERINARDSYTSYTRQLQQKGKGLKLPFTEVTVPSEEIELFDSRMAEAMEESEDDNIFMSSHLELDDTEDPESHPWALSRHGDTIDGEYFFDVSATPNTTNVGPDGEALIFDGMRPGGELGHKHRGLDVDGTRKLDACESINFETLCTPLVDHDEFVCPPEKLREQGNLECVAADGRVDVNVAWDCEGNEYEIQIVPVCDPAPGPACLIGHLYDYPETACEPWEDGRIYLNVGDDVGLTDGELPLIPLEENLAYQVSKSFSLALGDDYFVVGMDSNDLHDFEIALCVRETAGNGPLDYIELDHIKLATPATLTQGRVSVAAVNSTDFLVGCMDSDDAATYVGDVPTVFLVRANIDGTAATPSVALEVLDRMQLWPIGSETYYGVQSMHVIDDQHFAIGITIDDPETEEILQNHKARIISGSLYREPGTDSNNRIAIASTLDVGSGYGWTGPEVRFLSNQRIVVLYREMVTNPLYSLGYYVKVLQFDNMTGSITSASEPYFVLKEADYNGYAYIEVRDDDEFAMLWSQPNSSGCDDDGNETLRIRAFEADLDTNVVSSLAPPHVIDAAFNTTVTETENIIGMTPWIEGDSYLVVWSSDYDNPTTNIPYRMKAALLSISPSVDDYFDQEVWDLPITSPTQHAHNSISPSRFGNTEYFLIAAGGDASQQPRVFDPTLEVVTGNYAGEEAYIVWKDPDEVTAVVPVAGRSGTAWLKDDGTTIGYIWVKNGSGISQGEANNLDEFYTQNGSVTETDVLMDGTGSNGMSSPGCAVMRHPDTGYLYLIIQAKSFGSGSYPLGDLRTHVAGFSAGDQDWGSHIIFRSTNDGDSWTYYSYIQHKDGTGDQATHIYNSGHQWDSTGEDVQISPIFITSTGAWLVSVVNFRSLTGGQAGQVLFQQPSVWRSTDEGLTWSLIFDSAQGSYGSQSGASGRNFAEIDGRIYYSTGADAVVTQEMRVHYSDDDGLSFSSWNGANYDNNHCDPDIGIYAPGPPAFFTTSHRGEEKLHSWYGPTDGHIRVYDSLPESGDIIVHQDTECATTTGDIIYRYGNTSPTTYYGGRGSFVQVVGNSVMLQHSNNSVIGMYFMDPGTHNGLSALIVDRCSAPGS